MSTHGEQTRNESYQSEQAVATGKRAVVLEFVRARGKTGATREEIADGTELTLSSVCGRVNELEEAGLLETTAMRRIGMSGKSHSVVCAVEAISDAIGSAERCERRNCEAERRDGPGDSRQSERTEAQGSCGNVRCERVDGARHPITKELAALKAKPAEQQLNLF